MKRDETKFFGMSSSADANHALGSVDIESKGAGATVSRVEKWLVDSLLKAAGNPPMRVVLWDGYEIGTAQPVARVLIRDRGALWALFLNPDLRLGELYTSGRLEVEGDLVACMEAVDRSMPDFPDRGFFTRLLARSYLLRRNTLTRAEDNIHHHYDIGNEFYRLWLDKAMVYTCAYFPDVAMSLEEAQMAKLDHVCRKLQLQPGKTVVEAGCGWGALALHMARRYGAQVKAYNISREQVAYAREQAKKEGLEERVEFILGDYRKIEGQYDAFVSVGMLEHVGISHYRELGGVINACLKASGRGLIHSIGRNRPAPMNAWIEKHIFPGAYPPSLREMMGILEPFRLSVLDVENLRLHYALTLQHWLQRYEAAVEQVEKMFDIPFVRAWRLYLAGSIAAFRSGELQLFQVVFARHNDNEIPFSRDFLYTQR